MKKFLFTLASLLMAGMMFAQVPATDYCYIDNREIQDAELGKTITVSVKAHFEYVVSAGQVNFILPEGITITRFAKGQDLKDLMMIHDASGEEFEDEEQVFMSKPANANFAFALATETYMEIDGEWTSVGGVAFVPGEYEDIVKVTFKIADTFNGGEIVVRTQPSCGELSRTDLHNPCPTGQDNYMTAQYTRPQSGPEEFTASGTITFAGNVATLQYTSNDDDAVATVTVNGTAVNVEFVNGKAEVEIPETDVPGTYSVPVVMTIAPGADGSHEGDNVIVQENYEYTVAKPTFVANPTITFDANGVATLSMNANDPNATAVVTVDGETANVAFENGVATLPLTLSTEVGDHSIVVVMTVSPSADYEGQPASATGTYTYTVAPSVDPDAAVPVITFTPNEAGVQVNIENYTEYTIKVNGVQVDPARALPYQVNQTYQQQVIDVYAKNAPAGFTAKDASDSYTLTAKANEASQPATLGTPYTDANNLYIPVNGNVQSILVDGAPFALNAAGELVLPRAEQPWTPESIVIVTNDSSTDPYIPCDDATANFDGITVPAWVTVPAIDLVEGNSNGHWVDSYVDDQGNPVWGHMEYDETGHCMNVTFSTTYEDAILYYQILDEDGNILAAYSGQTEDQSVTVTLNENGKYTAVAWVVLPNDESRRNVREFEIDDMTNVNELVNGKTVANVRYFNVAGQEMQEANGMTIVVTTYTDGTTSTVKVMK